jgi:hypothetical protein
MGLSAELRIKLSARKTGSQDFGGPDFSPVLEKLFQIADGAGGIQADIIWLDERGYSASTADAIDLYGVLTDAFGAVINAAEIVGVFILNESKAGVRGTVTLTVGAGSAPWFGMFGATGNSIKVPPGGMFALIAPDANGLGAITPTTADILTITPGAGSGAYQIAVLARTS